MLNFMREGGYAMWFILVLGAITLGVAVSFAIRPAERKLSVLRPMSLATLFFTLSGLFAGLAATMKAVTGRPEFAESPDLHRYVMIGLGEAMCNAILGFSLLAVVWLVTAVGMRRQA